MGGGDRGGGPRATEDHAVGGLATVDDAVPGDHAFALCLTHDVDRPFKRLPHVLYHAVRDRSASHLRAALAGRNPYWQFDAVTAIESARGVRSAFYFLSEPPIWHKRPGRWATPRAWIEELGRYDVRRPPVAGAVRRLADGGWEVGLHGSLASAVDGDRLRAELDTLESVAGAPVVGGRQHRLRLDGVATWRRQRAAGLRYDSSLGSPTSVGFRHGHAPLAPFGDDFLVFPLTLMESALPDPGERFDAARATCEALLAEAADEGAVMTVLWHPRLFARREFPGYARLYDHLLERALAMDAWVGPPGDLHAAIAGDRRPAAAAAPDP